MPWELPGTYLKTKDNGTEITYDIQVSILPAQGCAYCSNECELVEVFDGTCGDGRVDIPYEECDGQAGIGPHQECSEECTLEDLTYCGDNIKQFPNDDGKERVYVVKEGV